MRRNSNLWLRLLLLGLLVLLGYLQTYHSPQPSTAPPPQGHAAEMSAPS